MRGRREERRGGGWVGRVMGKEEGAMSWAPAIANGEISHGSVATAIVTANAGRPFVTGARDGESGLRNADGLVSRHSASSSAMNDPRGSHLSVLVDLSPSQWHSSARHAPPLSLATFLSQLLAFLNSYIALKHENTLAVFGALPGKRYSPSRPQSCRSSLLASCSIPPATPRRIPRRQTQTLTRHLSLWILPLSRI